MSSGGFKPAAIARLGDDALEGLTSQQQLFVSHIISGMSYIEAYAAAGYEVKPNDPNSRARAAALAVTPAVQAKLRALREERDAKATLAPLLTRDFVVTGIMTMATTAKSETVKLRALQLLGQTAAIDLFRPSSEPAKRARTTEEIDAELKRRLDSFTTTIDGTATAKPAAPDRRRKPSSK